MKQRGFEPRLPLKNATASISLQKYTEAVKAKQEKVDPIEALELNDEIAFWEGVKGILAERNGAAAPVAENEMQPVEGAAQPVEGVQPTIAGSIESSSRQSEIGGTPSLLDVVRTLYSKGKEVASKLFQRSFFDVAQTPKFMQELGSRGDKFSIKYGVIARHLGKDSSHTLTERDWEQLPQALQNPFAISKLTDKEDSYRIYTTLQTESGEFVVVGADVKNAGREIEVNAVSTVFGRRNNANLPKNEEVIYRSKEITPEQSSLLERPNFAQYPTEQELSKGKGTINSPTANDLGKKITEAEAEVNTTPTDKQKEAGNYKKGHVQIGTFNVTIEQPKGSVRSGVDKGGKKWEVEMQNTYGYIRGTEGVDGDHIDVFLSDDIDGWDGRKVFVVDQRNTDGSFDEHKVMLGFNDINDAEAAYMSNYEEGWQGLGAITGVSIEEFEKWIASSHRKTKAFAEYKSVKTTEGQSAPGQNAAPKKKRRKSPTTPQELAVEALAQAEENRRKPLRARAQEWAAKTGGPVTRVESIEEVKNAEARAAIEQGEEVGGWYETGTQSVYLYLPNLKSIAEVDYTYIHEVVGHKGLRRLFGGKFDEMLFEVFGSAPKNVRAEIMRRALDLMRRGRKNFLHEAVEEYLTPKIFPLSRPYNGRFWQRKQTTERKIIKGSIAPSERSFRIAKSCLPSTDRQDFISLNQNIQVSK